MNINTTIIVLEEINKFQELGKKINKDILLYNLGEKSDSLYLRAGSDFDDFLNALTNEGKIQEEKNNAFSLTLLGIKELNKLKKKEWDQSMLALAKEVAKKSTCIRNQVGAVIADYDVYIGAGFNGPPKHQKNCKDFGFCYRNQNNIKSGTSLEKCHAVGSHAETNAIIDSLPKKSVVNSTLYLVGHNFICSMCKAIILNVGISRVIVLNLNNEIIEYNPKIDWNIHDLERKIN
jgi:dCMP deaminase